MNRVVLIRLDNGTTICHDTKPLGYMPSDYSRIFESEKDYMKYEMKEARLKEIEDQCVKYNEMLAKFHEDYPGCEIEVMEMLRRAKQRGCSETTRKTD